MARTQTRAATVRRSFAVALVGGLLAGVMAPGGPARADAVRDDSWQIAALELPELHKITQGEGVTVAVVDTGVDAAHPDLVGNVLPGVDLYDDKTKGQIDRKGHGTGMASLIAGHGHGPDGRDGVLGVAPKAKILPITVQPKNTGIIPPDGIATAIDWAVDHGAQVINVSLSSSADSDIDRAVERAFSRNVLVVASVGNKADSILIGSPAKHNGTLAVTGTDRSGTKVGPESIPAKETDIAAPSVDIVHATLAGKYVTATGTSGATALVSGAAALVRAKYPDIPLRELFWRLAGTAKDTGPPGKDQDFGYGVLDLRRALTGEPDPRPSAEAEAEEPADLVPLPAPAENGGITSWLYALLAWVVILGVITVVVVLIIRLRRRRRPLSGR